MTDTRKILCGIATAIIIALVPATGAWAQTQGGGSSESSGREADTGGRIAMPPPLAILTHQPRPGLQRIRPKTLVKESCGSYEYVAITRGSTPIYVRRCRDETPQ